MQWPRTDRSAEASAATALAEVIAIDHARIMGAAIATVRDWQVAEDALQDACERALTAWTQDGVTRGLEVLDGVRNSETSYLHHAAPADLLEAAGQRAEARRAYIRAATLAPGDTERAALNDKEQALVDRTAPP